MLLFFLKYDAFTSTNNSFQREKPMVMFANDRLYSFANVVEHEDNKVFRTNDKTVVLYTNNFEEEILQIVIILFSIFFFFVKWK